MRRLALRLTEVFSAGCLGGLANSVCLWLFGVLGITAAAGVKLSPTLAPSWLYPRIVWGGLWGFLFLLPLWRQSVWRRGVLLSFGPSMAQWFIVFPLKAHQGTFGLGLGMLTPLFVLLFNGIWGIAAAHWLAWISAEISASARGLPVEVPGRNPEP